MELPDALRSGATGPRPAGARVLRLPTRSSTATTSSSGTSTSRTRTCSSPMPAACSPRTRCRWPSTRAWPRSSRRSRRPMSRPGPMGRRGPRPVLVTGVERRVAIETNPDPAAGRPNGLYGNAFAAADPDAVRRATTPIDAADRHQPGRHRGHCRRPGSATRETRSTGLSSPRTRASAPPSWSRTRLAGSPARVVVHTGYWGCGAFGGNRVLMAMLQVLAARMAGLERLVFHTGSPGGDAPLVRCAGASSRSSPVASRS